MEFANAYLQLTLIIWGRYFFVAGLFFLLLWGRPAKQVRAARLSRRRPEWRIMRHEILMSLASSMIYAVPGVMVLLSFREGGTAIYMDVASIGGPLIGALYIPISIFVYLLIHDAYFYWTHRAMHHPSLFKATHLTHHRSRNPTPWAAFSFHPWEAILSAWLLPAVAFIIPIHGFAVLFLLILMTYCSVANHAGWEILPSRWLKSPIGRQLISARHHDVHHKDYNSNYGLYFRFWDHWMKTDNGLAPILKKKNKSAVETIAVESSEFPAKPEAAASWQ